MGENIEDKKSTALSTAMTTITTKSPSVDAAWQDATTTTPYGLATQNEADSAFEAIRINQLRIGEIETALKLAGILA